MKPDISALAERIDRAAREAQATAQFAAQAGLDLAGAYAVQAASLQRRLARGERRTGIKMGFTSRAKMAQMGVAEMIWGRLTDGMQLEEGAAISMARFVHPRVEPEVAFLLARPLSGPVTLAEAAAATAAVAPALELIDSRFEDFRFSLEDVVADNASSSGYVIGSWQPPHSAIDNLGLVLTIDGQPRQVGCTAAILGNPWRSLVAAAALSAAAGEPLQAGWVVLAGGATAAEALAPGQHVRCEMQTLGSVEFETRA
jgi:2-oxo-3-hexenedioate decarboxylase